jgi:hypothetical protein
MVSQQTDSSNSQQTESSSLRGKGKGSRPTDPLAKVIEALVRDGKFISEYEWPLRLFQFMYWLIDDVETKVSLKEAALLFCSMAISQESDKVKKRFLSASGAELLLLTESDLREYFAKVKGLLPILNKPLADKLDDAWSNLEPISIDPLQPLDVDDMHTAGIGKKLRRSAEETKAGGRQRPRSK